MRGIGAGIGYMEVCTHWLHGGVHPCSFWQVADRVRLQRGRMDGNIYGPWQGVAVPSCLLRMRHLLRRQVDPLPEVDFGKDLGAAINFNFEDHLTVHMPAWTWFPIV